MNNKVLLVDDEPLVLKALQRVLGGHLDLCFATDGVQALAMLESHGPFAAVVCDIRMPGMNGLDVLREMRRRSPETVRLALSGHADFDAAIAAVNDGAVFRFHTKPVSPEVLQASIDGALLRHHQEKRSRGLIDPTDDLLQDVSALRKAFERNEFRLHFQPQRHLADGRTTGAEALIRWEHPERGLLGPADFLGTAESAGLLEPLTAWVLDRALAEARRWSDCGHHSLRVAVNITAMDLSNSAFPALVERGLKKHGVPAERLELEVTEGFALNDLGTASSTLQDIARLGVTISIDDFGTGYSSFKYLSDLPISKLKIDRSFVQHLHENPDDARIVETIISLARTLKLSTVAEGIETEEQLHRLIQANCDDVQGYLIAKPMPADEFLTWLAA